MSYPCVNCGDHDGRTAMGALLCHECLVEFQFGWAASEREHVDGEQQCSAPWPPGPKAQPGSRSSSPPGLGHRFGLTHGVQRDAGTGPLSVPSETGQPDPLEAA